MASPPPQTFVPPPTTTLGGAAAELASAPRSSRILLPLALIFALGAAVSGWRWLHQAPPPPTVVTAAPAPPEETPVAKIHLTLDSNPSGAEVFRASDGIRIGVTPLDHEHTSAPGNAEYLLKLHGYRDTRATVPLDHDVNQVIALERSHARARSKDKQPIKNGVMDPFAN